jgi:hypothetical protein
MPHTPTPYTEHPDIDDEHYTRLEASADTHRHPDCGCRLARNDDGSVALYHCPTHAAAPAMLALVKQVAGGHDPDPDVARALLRAVED